MRVVVIEPEPSRSLGRFGARIDRDDFEVGITDTGKHVVRAHRRMGSAGCKGDA